MPGLSVEEMESRLSAVRCAICKTNVFGIERRSMQPDGSAMRLDWMGKS
jgi:hypothetical protein